MAKFREMCQFGEAAASLSARWPIPLSLAVVGGGPVFFGLQDGRERNPDGLAIFAGRGHLEGAWQQAALDKPPHSIGPQTPTAGQLANAQSATLCCRTCHCHNFTGMIAVATGDSVHLGQAGRPVAELKTMRNAGTTVV